MQHTATIVPTQATLLQHTATHCNNCVSQTTLLQHTATQCNKLHHTATHCNNCVSQTTLLQHTATQHKCSNCTNSDDSSVTHCNTLQYTATIVPTQTTLLQHTATHCNTLQQHCNTLYQLKRLFPSRDRIRRKKQTHLVRHCLTECREFAQPDSFVCNMTHLDGIYVHNIRISYAMASSNVANSCSLTRSYVVGLVCIGYDVFI